jgi:cell division septal protein FtsQ
MKKNKSKDLASRENFQLDKLLVVKAIAGIIIVSFVLTIYHNLKKSEYFRVREVTVRQGANISQDERNFAYLVGRNIFDLDLEKEARHAAYYYPSYQRVRITRFLPGHLVVDFLMREPLAYIKNSRIFYIDENMIVFELPSNTAVKDLPSVTGVERYVLGAKYGSKCNSAAIATALNIIKTLSHNRILKGYNIKNVDMAGLDDASIFLLVSQGQIVYTKTDYVAPEQILEVKIGREDIRNKLSLLATLLSQVRNNIHNIEYIDLRFKDPVIKFKERT